MHAAGSQVNTPSSAGDSVATCCDPGTKHRILSVREIMRHYPYVVIAAVILTAVLAAIFVLFHRLTGAYKSSVVAESARYLQEINYQIATSVEESVENDWQLAHTVAAFLEAQEYDYDDRGVLELVKKVGKTWGTTDITVYTEDGSSARLDGSCEPRDVASERAAKARRYGEYVTVVDSAVTYIVAVDTVVTYHESPIVALSVVKDMGSILDDMVYASFDNAAHMYLTDDRGKTLSHLTVSGTVEVFNAVSLLADTSLTDVTGAPADPDILLTAALPTVLVTGDRYIVTAPVHTRQSTLRLIYAVPRDTVNASMDSYTARVVSTSLIVLLLFAVCAILVILFQYREGRKRFDTALLARERMLDLLVKNSSTAFCLFDLHNPAPAFVSANIAAITGEGAPMLRRAAEGFRMTDAAGAEPPQLAKLNEGLHAWDGRSVFRSGFLKNDSVDPSTYFEVQIFPINSGTEEFVCVVSDVTQLEQREEAVRTALVLAERGSEAKSRFLANMSHDIRTPMNTIVNLTNFAIEEQDDRGRLMEYLQTIRSSSDQLLMLINDVLEMSRIESGKAVLTAEPFDLRRELSRIRGIVTPQCAGKGQSLLCDFAGVTTDAVTGDRTKVSQILLNLLSNAIKFTPDGGVIRFTAQDMPSLREDVALIRFTVEDNGIGIPEEFVPRVFDAFARADEKRVSGVQGTGLGLSICHSYVTAMGGHIRCQSEQGKGSMFTVDLPFSKTETLPEQPASGIPKDAKPFLGLRCLLCEDVQINRRIAAAVLERLGMTIETADDGREAMRLFLASPCGYYSVIYMDIQMPVMDGYEATAAIRASDREDAGSVPIIAMTANVFIEDIEKAHIAGMDGHVGKPISPETIAAETARVLQQKRREQL